MDAKRIQQPRDTAMVALRVVILLGGFAYTTLEADPAKKGLLFETFLVFALYGIVLYAVLYQLLASQSGKRFYYVAGTLDLLFAIWVISQTGGAASPFFRALYLWVALFAFLFGFETGIVVSGIAFTVLLSFDLRAGWPEDPMPLILQAAGILMHGPLVGFLADRERARVKSLQAAGERLTAVNRQLVDEQTKLIHAEKLSSIGLLASGVAHEINNPLSGIMGCVKLLREEAIPVERREEYFDAVRDGLERIRGTVQSLLDFARQRPPMPVEQDASDVVASCVRLLQPLERKKDLSVENQIVPGEVRVHADRTQLMQALVNVLMNSIHAVQPGGHIAIKARPDGARVGIRIEDDGAGIPPEVLNKVCDPFFTTKPEGEGTGLGLAITLNILRAHGGDLDIESPPGKGTQVTLWLPRVQKAQETALA